MEAWHIIVLIVNIVMVMIGALLSIISWMARTAFIELKSEVLDLRRQEIACRESLPKEYASWEALLGPEGILTDIKRDRRDRWRDYERHQHTNGMGPPVKVGDRA